MASEAKPSEEQFAAIITEVAGEDVLPLVSELQKKTNVSEFKLAEAIGREINTTRNMLYRLYNKNLVSFSRKKDKKKGWYIYYWTFNDKAIGHLQNAQRKKRLEMLEARLAKEKNNVFFSGKGKLCRLTFEEAANHFFRCPESGEMLFQEDNSGRVKIISQTVEDLKAEIEREKEEDRKRREKAIAEAEEEERKEEEKAAKKLKLEEEKQERKAKREEKLKLAAAEKARKAKEKKEKAAEKAKKVTDGKKQSKTKKSAAKKATTVKNKATKAVKSAANKARNSSKKSNKASSKSTKSAAHTNSRKSTTTKKAKR